MKLGLIRLGLAGLLMLASAGCQTPGPASTPSTPVTPRSKSTLVLLPPIGASQPAQPVETAALTPVPWSTPAAIPDTWQTFSSADWPISFRYPADWQAESAARYGGPDGFFELAWVPHTPSVFDSLTTICTLEANRGKPAAYGAHPFVTNWWRVPTSAGGCVIYPSEDQPARVQGQATFFLRLPAELESTSLLALRVDKQHLGALASTLHFTGESDGTATPSSGFYDAPACHTPPPPATPVGSPLARLALNEHAVASAACHPYNQFDGFQAAIPREAKVALHTWQETRRVGELAQINAALAPFGYRLDAKNPPYSDYDLYRGEMAVIKGVTHFGPLTVARDKGDFALWLHDRDHGERSAMLVRRTSVVTYTWTDVFDQPFDTAYVGNDLLALAYDRSRTTPDRPGSQLNVLRNGAVIYTLAIPPFTPGGGPVRGLTAWGDHWVLEADNVVVMDGKILNDELGYDEVFEWRLLGGKPFYFFRQGRQVGLSYDGQVLPYRYDDIIHGFLCCDPAVYNVQSSSAGVWFYAQKDGVWYEVEISGE